MKTFTTIPEKSLIVSYKLAQLLVKKKKAHMDAEEIIKPALEIAIEIMLGSEAAAKIKNIPLSRRTISRRIVEMSDDIMVQFKDHFAQDVGQYQLSNI